MVKYLGEIKIKACEIGFEYIKDLSAWNRHFLWIGEWCKNSMLQ